MFGLALGRMGRNGGVSADARIRAMFGAADDGYYWNFARADTLFQDTARTTPAANGDPIGGITDLSGKGRHATQATATARPLRGVDGGGRLLSTYDGVDDCIGTTASAASNAGTTIVAMSASTSGGRPFGSSDQYCVFRNGANYFYALTGASGTLDTTIPVNAAQVLTFRKASLASVRIYRGLTLTNTTTALNNGAAGGLLGACRPTSPIFFSALSIYAAFHITRELTDAEFNFVVTRFGALSGVTV
jgi:hypothetical protein